MTRTDPKEPEDPDGLGCFIWGDYLHLGVRVWHPIENREYPYSFQGMTMKEEIVLWATDGDDSSEEIQQAMTALVNEATHSTTIDDQNRINDNHGIGAGAAVFDEGATQINLIQVWRITTSDWNVKNDNHAVGQTVDSPTMSHWHTLIFKQYSGDFVRAWKDGCTCNCDGPSDI